jgi:putative ATP-binding cassette transporter
MRVSLATLVALLGGACNAALIAVVNNALTSTEASRIFLVWSIGAIGLARVVTGATSQVMLVTLAQNIMLNLRRDLCRRILVTPLRHLEKIGPFRLLVALTEDTMAVRTFLSSIPQLTVDIAILIACVVYLTWLSWTVSLVMLTVVTLAVISYRVLLAKALRFLRRAREVQDTLYGHYRAMTEGIKELRIHRTRREAFLLQNIEPATDAFRRHSVVAMTHFIIANGWSQFVFFAVIGLLLFFVPNFDNVNNETLTGYVITILYLMGPMREVMHIFPNVGRATIAMNKIESLGLSAATQTREDEALCRRNVTAWRCLDLEQVVFVYRDGLTGCDFTLGPVDLTISPNEIVFIIGGNGSGKSTLAKLLVGLYSPEAGEIRLNGERITDENREWYRQHFSVIFSDFYLFEGLLGLESQNLDKTAREYLSVLQLGHKVEVQNGGLSTTALSQGQRRRLALLTAYLEDRPIYVFDEWAADQDPHYKKVFYTQLLPELRAKGKGVVVITHDDRYFDVADRIVKLDYGKAVIQTGNVAGVFVGCAYPQDGKIVT